LISAVTFAVQFDAGVPLRWAIGGKYIKQLLDQRGYAESKGFAIGVEFSDGWRPYRARLMGDHVAIEQEAEPLQFAIWLARRVAYYRLQRMPHLDDGDRGYLDRVVVSDDGFGLREVTTSSRLWRTLRVGLPGHRPVSVELDAYESSRTP
jgi:hypothetical protein